MTTIDLTPHLRNAAATIREMGWRGERERDATAPWGITYDNAIQASTGRGAEYAILGEVLHNLERWEDWQSSWGMTTDQILTFLDHAVLTDADLERVYGPDWEAVVSFVRAMEGVTASQISQMAEIYLKSYEGLTYTVTDENDSYFGETLRATIPSERPAMKALLGVYFMELDQVLRVKGTCEIALRLWEPIWVESYPSFEASGSSLDGWEYTQKFDKDLANTFKAIKQVVDDLAEALAVRRFLGVKKFTRADYDFLAAPWSIAVGSLHPDDADLNN